MKCPKCGYLGFERVERCRNCGYDFPVTEFRGLPELPLRGRDADNVGLLDLALTNPATSPASPNQPAPVTPDLGPVLEEPSNTPGDLPLFGSAAAEARLLGPRALPARPPLAVRRATPEVARVRIEQPRAPMLDLGPADPEPATPATRAARESPMLAVEPASLTARVLAGIIDLAILAAVDGLVIYFTLQICGLTIDDLSLLPKGPLVAFLLVQNGGYLVAFTAGGGQTLGKMSVGIKVVQEAGASRMDLGHAAMRTLAWALLAIPAGLGFLPALFNDDHRGLHDRWAGTRVVRAGTA